MISGVLKRLDPFIKILILVGIAFYLLELSIVGIEELPRQRFIAVAQLAISVIFTIEYVLRWMDNAQTHSIWRYPRSALGIIDLLAIAPFWLGLLLPAEWLYLTRILKIFRLLKYFRYSRSLQLTALAFFRAAPSLRPLCFSLLVIVLFCSVAILETEHAAQPEKFDNLFDAVYFTLVTVATVGYGDLTPITPQGRLVVLFTCLTGLTLFAGMLGVIGATFSKVTEEELNPDVDPIAEFKAERQRQLAIRDAKIRERRDAKKSKAEYRS